MSEITMKELLEAGVHFGHQTQRWNPKMSPFIFTQRGGIHIFDLAQTKKRLEDAIGFIKETVGAGGTILFLGTKKQAKKIIKEEAIRCEMPYVTERWLGGMFTNFSTISKRIFYLKELESKKEKGEFDSLTKKEKARIDEKIYKLNHILGGVKKMGKPPEVIFIIDLCEENIAAREARKLNIPIIGVLDSNTNPEGIDYPIPANDDALKSIRLITKLITDAVLEGKGVIEKQAVKDDSVSVKNVKDNQEKSEKILDKNQSKKEE